MFTIPQSSLVGGFKPSEKYESQLGLFFPIYGKITTSCSKPPTRSPFFGWWYMYKASPVDMGRLQLDVDVRLDHDTRSLKPEASIKSIQSYGKTKRSWLKICPFLMGKSRIWDCWYGESKPKVTHSQSTTCWHVVWPFWGKRKHLGYNRLF